MKDIAKFAAETPFSVNGLTASFVKLANQGFVPTIKELTKLGDLAAASGKEFDMLAEAIIDAQVGEFERLKEFGIRSQKEGDKVKFTFKGVKTQVDFTSDSIRDYLVGLGDVEGVSGGMAAISDTVAGKISNLGDKFDAVKTAIGNSNSGFIAAMIDATASVLDFALSDDALGLFGVNVDSLTEEMNGFIEAISGNEASDQLALIRKEMTLLAGIVENSIDGVARVEAQQKINILKSRELDILADIDTAGANALEATRKAKEKQVEFAASLRASALAAEALADEVDDLAFELVDIPVDKFQQSLNSHLLALETNLQSEYDLKVSADSRDLERQLAQDEAELALAEENARRTTELALRTASSIFDVLIQFQGYRIATLQQEMDYELELAGDNVTERTRIEEEYGERIAEARRKQANLAKAQGIFQAAINTAIGVTLALALAGPIAGPILAGIIGALGAAQITLIAATPIPTFEEGGRIGGKRHSQGGTLIEAETGEHVMSRKATSKYGHDIFDRLNRMELDPNVLSGHSGGSVHIVDTKPIADALSKQTVNQINIDGNGFNRKLIRDQYIMNQKFNRYST
jgi:hypothetical protein